MSTSEGQRDSGPQDVVTGRGSSTSPAGGSHHGAGGVATRSSTRKSSTWVKLGITAAVATAGVAIVAAVVDDDDEPTHAAVCVDKNTQERVDDDRCNTGYHGPGFFGWYFFAYGMNSPRVGAPVSGGSYSAPAGSSYVTGGVPRQGGVVSADTVKGGTKTTARGGFGSNSKGSGG